MLLLLPPSPFPWGVCVRTRIHIVPLSHYDKCSPLSPLYLLFQQHSLTLKWLWPTHTRCTYYKPWLGSFSFLFGSLSLLLRKSEPRLTHTTHVVHSSRRHKGIQDSRERGKEKRGRKTHTHTLMARQATTWLLFSGGSFCWEEKGTNERTNGARTRGNALSQQQQENATTTAKGHKMYLHL